MGIGGCRYDDCTRCCSVDIEGIQKELAKYKAAFEVLKEANGKSITLCWDHYTHKKSYGESKLSETICDDLGEASNKVKEMMK